MNNKDFDSWPKYLDGAPCFQGGKPETQGGKGPPGSPSGQARIGARVCYPSTQYSELPAWWVVDVKRMPKHLGLGTTLSLPPPPLCTPAHLLCVRFLVIFLNFFGHATGHAGS